MSQRRLRQMTDKETVSFLDIMKRSGDLWSLEDAQRVYRDISLKEALQDRTNDLIWFSNIVHKANKATKRKN